MKTVYFIKPIGMVGPVKVGCSKSPESRRECLENWSPFPLEIIAQIEGGHDIERRFHALLLAHHQRREWFNWHRDVQAVIDSVNAGTFDLATLPEPMGVAAKVGGKKVPRTPEQRRQLSYSLRCAHMLTRSGHACPIESWNVIYRGDPDEIATVDRYLADPLNHGKLIRAPWAEERAAAYAANQSTCVLRRGNG